MTKPRNVIGPIVKKIRLQQKMSQTELAVRCQLFGWDASRDIVFKIEAQVRWVADFEIAGLAKALKVPVAMLYPNEAASLRILRRNNKAN